MADIRINALATTAASTASDDFVAVDGSANGTRKLNAYSPTFGGNLTVSGVTTSAGVSNSGALTFTAAAGQIAGSIAKNATYGLTYYGVTGSSNDNTMLNASGAVVLSNPAGTTNATLAGNLTVSGNTANFGGSDSSPTINFKAADTGSVTLNFGGTTNPDKGRILYTDNSDAFLFYTTDTERMRLTNGGNLLIGTTTDGGQKLQVAGVVNSSGAGYTNSGYQITNTTASRTTGWFQNNSGTTVLRDVTGAADLLSVDTSGNATFVGSTGVQLKNDSFLYFGSTVRTAVKGNSTGSLELYANNGLSLTLDSSQNATFAKKMAINGAALTYDFNLRASTSNTGSTAFRFEQANGTEILAIRDNGTAIFAGDIRINNTVNTVSPTSPNRTITMTIGGTTYYIPAKTTND